MKSLVSPPVPNSKEEETKGKYRRGKSKFEYHLARLVFIYKDIIWGYSIMALRGVCIIATLVRFQLSPVRYVYLLSVTGPLVSGFLLRSFTTFSRGETIY